MQDFEKQEITDLIIESLNKGLLGLKDINDLFTFPNVVMPFEDGCIEIRFDKISRFDFEKITENLWERLYCIDNTLTAYN